MPRSRRRLNAPGVRKVLAACEEANRKGLSVVSGLNGRYMALKSLMAIMSRMSDYTGKTLSWDQAMNSQEDLSPSEYSWDAAPPNAEVAVPGLTPLV